MITTRTSATVWGTALLLCGASPWAFAQLDENALDKALARGADKVLRKPFSNEQLLTAVKELVN